MSGGRLAVALLVLVLVGRADSTAQADTRVELPKTKAVLELPDGWRRAEQPGLVAVYRTDAGAILVVSRSDVPNGNAWSDDAPKREAHADALERGIRTGIPGYRRSKRKLAKVNGVPALDLEATRDGGATVLMRVLLFRTYVLALAIEVTGKADLAAARTIVTRFGPPPDAPTK